MGSADDPEPPHSELRPRRFESGFCAYFTASQ